MNNKLLVSFAKWILIIIGGGFLTSYSLDLMNTKSTLENILGFVILAFLVFSIIVINKDRIKVK